MICRRLVVTGKVQGVWYRSWFAERARALGLDGWVRNRMDGSVEAVIQGEPDKVAAMIVHAREGSPASRVADVRVHDHAQEEAPGGFEQRPTA